MPISRQKRSQADEQKLLKWRLSMLTESLSRLECKYQSKCVFSLPASCFWGIYNWFSFQIASHFVNSFLGEIFSFSVFPPFLLFTSHNSPFSPCCKGTIGHHCNTSKQWYWIWSSGLDALARPFSSCQNNSHTESQSWRMNMNNQDLPKNIDRDSDKDNEDAADAYHRKHPVVHYLPVWV